MRLFCAVLAARLFRAKESVLLLALAGAVLVCASVTPASPAHAQETQPSQPTPSAREMDLAAYLAELDRASTAVSRLNQNPAETPALRESLPKAWPVRIAGQRFEVSTSWLGSALETMETTPAVRASLQKDIEGRIQLLRQQAEALERSDAGLDPAAARAKLESILHQREFRLVHGPTWWDHARARFWNWFFGVLRRFFGGLAGTPRTRELVVWGLIALAFVLLALWVKSALLRAARARGLEIGAASLPGKTWRDWAREALAAAARQDHRDAIHAAYWAGVYRLRDLGAWQLDRARTPREYLRLLAREAAAPGQLAAQGSVAPAEQAERAAALAALTRSLETTWYGYRPATASDFRAALSQLEALGCRFPSNLATANS